jgi:RNA polymerase sigma-70 factor (sigma-E family)
MERPQPSQLPETLTAFVEERGASLMRAAVLLTGDPQTAQDLSQDTLARMIGVWPRLRTPAAAHSYAIKTMTRLYWSQRKRHWNDEVPSEALWDGASPQEDLASAVSVRLALRRIPPGQRTALVLRYFLDLSVEDVAHAMHCSKGNVKSQCSRGIARLAELLVEPSRSDR